MGEGGEPGGATTHFGFQTVPEEFLTTRPAFRWRQVTALARVTASAYGHDRQDRQGFRAAGYEEACRLLGVEA